jgi:hypothetical protein
MSEGDSLVSAHIPQCAEFVMQARNIQASIEETMSKVDLAIAQLMDARVHADKSACESELRAQSAAAAAEALRKRGPAVAKQLAGEAEQVQQEEQTLRTSAQLLKDKVCFCSTIHMAITRPRHHGMCTSAETWLVLPSDKLFVTMCCALPVAAGSSNRCGSSR